MSQSQPESSFATKPIAFSIMRWVGYGLLVLTILDYIAVLLPTRLMNPAWEFETMGSIIERIPVPLLAAALIFFGENQARSKWEKPLLKVLSWASLVFAIVLFLMIPFWGINNTLRLNTQTQTQINSQYNAQVEQLDQVEEHLNQASSEEIIELLESQGFEVEGAPGSTKEQLLNQLEQVRQRVKTQADTERGNRGQALFESSIKWNLSAFISGALFAYIWRLTRWARGAAKKKAKAAKREPKQA